MLGFIRFESLFIYQFKIFKESKTAILDKLLLAEYLL